MIIIGITGTIGAGKGTIVDYLCSHKNFVHYSVREYLLREIKKQQLEPNRDSMVLVANRLRKNHSPSFIIDELMEEALQKQQNSVIESIRAEGEVVSLRKQPQFYLLAVDARPELRYERIKKRNSETDHVDFNTFMENEKREISSSDPNKQNLKKCIELSDFVLTNDGTKEDLYSQLENVLAKLL